MPESVPNQNGELAPSAVQQRQRLAQPVHRGDGRLRDRARRCAREARTPGALDQAAHLALDALVALRLDERGVEQRALGWRPDDMIVAPSRARPCGPRTPGRSRRGPTRSASSAPRPRPGKPRDRRVPAAARPPRARVGDVGERKRVPVDEQELLLEPDRERLALPKAVLRRCAALAQGSHQAPRGPLSARTRARPRGRSRSRRSRFRPRRRRRRRRWPPRVRARRSRGRRAWS